jgi:hypothetical protein
MPPEATKSISWYLHGIHCIYPGQAYEYLRNYIDYHQMDIDGFLEIVKYGFYSNTILTMSWSGLVNRDATCLVALQIENKIEKAELRI